MDLVNIAERLDADEKLKLKYRCFVKSGYGQPHRETVRFDKLLDVEPERGVLFVSFDDRDVIWVHIQEALEILPDDGVYGEAAGY
ncbi:MAG: hypothetical protein Q7T82_07560 [Armatimonadota bacterium]|nr:hypothetical protein [Armatimonadota bacterium]